MKKIIILILLFIDSCATPHTPKDMMDKYLFIYNIKLSMKKGYQSGYEQAYILQNTPIKPINYDSDKAKITIGYEQTKYGNVATNEYGEYIIEDWNVYYSLLLDTLKNSNTNNIYKFGRNQKNSQRFYDNFYFFEIYQVLNTVNGIHDIRSENPRKERYWFDDYSNSTSYYIHFSIYDNEGWYFFDYGYRYDYVDGSPELIEHYRPK